jgi:hypothetical protein
LSATISNGSVSFTPTQVDGFESSREAQTRVHPILGTSDVDVTERPASLRAGTLRLVFGDSIVAGGYSLEGGFVVYTPSFTTSGETVSKECEDVHAAGGALTFAASERDTIGMTYVVPKGGRIRRYLDPETRLVWILEVDYQEVTL